ncbi:MAG TPA: hypothetical protein VM265_07895 [Sphingomicrobium sp.]|nr:hypothetical protein [Sphingomicrobium sp.]
MRILGKAQEPLRVSIPANDDGEAAWVVLAPITPAMRRRAHRAARRLLGDIDPESITDAELDRLVDAGEAASRELIRLGVVEWGGMVGEDGEPFALTPDRETRLESANEPDRPQGTIDLLLADEEAFDLLDAAYVRPDAERRAEKNGLSASPSGTGEAATADKDIASSAAPAKPTGASRTAAAKSARTRKTDCAAKKRKTPGTS